MGDVVFNLVLFYNPKKLAFLKVADAKNNI